MIMLICSAFGFFLAQLKLDMLNDTCLVSGFFFFKKIYLLIFVRKLKCVEQMIKSICFHVLHTEHTLIFLGSWDCHICVVSPWTNSDGFLVSNPCKPRSDKMLLLCCTKITLNFFFFDSFILLSKDVH